MQWPGYISRRLSLRWDREIVHFLFRQAITDGPLSTRLVSIDPVPRREIAQHADEVIVDRVETLDPSFILSRLQRNDFLFIDSSHEIKTGNDVLYLYLRILPSLAPGVIVHMHDIFLPFEYPKEWIVQNRWLWGEQYPSSCAATGLE